MMRIFFDDKLYKMQKVKISLVIIKISLNKIAEI